MWHLLSPRWPVLIVGAAAIVLVYGIDALVTLFTGRDAGFWKYLSLVATIITGSLVVAAQFLWFKFVNLDEIDLPGPQWDLEGLDALDPQGARDGGAMAFDRYDDHFPANAVVDQHHNEVRRVDVLLETRDP